MKYLLLTTGLALAGCVQPPRSDPHVLAIVRRASQPDTAPKPPSGIASVRAEGIEGVREFAVAERKSQLKRFPCASCHTLPLEQLRLKQTGKKAAHWDVELRHAAENVMSCATCHPAEDADSLRTLQGKPVGLNHSYQVCAQCHAAQARDWAGGSHGRRASGWAAERVVNNCASCHNPHAPALPSRWPAIPRTDSR
ncbi:MAG: hypothetical protein K2X35_01485 [Bryobacteraceae bacterium]|nr:hypothetical protein [Bryobacteraceae bacterium]